MKTIIHLDLTDEQREIFSNALCRKGMVSRKEVNEWVNEAVLRLLTTQEHNNEPEIPSEAIESITEPRPPPAAFTPSRGDEPYLYRPQDPELAAACSAVLDGLAHIDQHVWATLERNRK